MTTVRRASSDFIPFESAEITPTTGGANVFLVDGSVWVVQLVMEVSTALSSSVTLSFPFSPQLGSGGGTLAPNIASVQAAGLYALIQPTPAIGDVRTVRAPFNAGIHLRSGTFAVQSSGSVTGGLTFNLSYVPGTGKIRRA